MTIAESQPQVSRILLDGHGGDQAPNMVLDAAKMIVDSEKNIHLGVVGQPDILAPALEQRGLSDRVTLIPASQIIDMSEAPAMALRRKKDSSMHVASRLLQDGSWDAFVSAGNTGALMAIPRLILRTVQGVDRPAIASKIPDMHGGYSLMLDAGANVDCSASHLLQFASMGSSYMHTAAAIKKPRVGLLNIGSESIKGTDVIKLAAKQLEASNLNFIGNVEGTDIFSGNVDVIVCDGFVGNVALKTLEGTAKFMVHQLKKNIMSSLSAKVGMVFAKKAMNRFKDSMDPGRYNGAPLLGLNGIVVKSHGSADAKSYVSAIMAAHCEASVHLVDEIAQSMVEWVDE
ncbi:MAG: phosphate acyltransferase PlsX [Mariprofundaceae bacterium]|nr:phosphate acyltransferase PlsX [Mariprofundaceae bacterium]